MEIKESPALTKVPPSDSIRFSSIQLTIDFLKEQISELKQQKKCYDKMIREREKTIKQLKKRKIMSR